MAYSVDDFSDVFSENSTETTANDDETSDLLDFSKINNVALQVLNRQIYGRFTKNCRAKTEKVFKKIHPQCRMSLRSLVKHPDYMQHIFMGFTLCSTYFLSFTEKTTPSESGNIFNMLESSKYEYELHLWRFRLGKELKYLAKYRIFKQLQGSSIAVDNVLFMQFPRDPHRVICYGVGTSNNPVAYMTILTLPSKGCRHCDTFGLFRNNDVISEGWCTKHGFILHYTFPLSNPSPEFNPHISLAYPDFIVVNTGHYMHILNITTSNPPLNNVSLNLKEEFKIGISFNDSQSEASESISEHYETNSVVDGILEDFNEYDLENGESNKPFHELNISCEPLNVTGTDKTSSNNSTGLLIVDPAGREQKPKWIKKVVRRYSNGDFENGSLLSGQSRDDFNMPIEIPLIAQTLSDQLLDVVPDCRADQITQMQLIITQRTFDCEQFVQRRAQQLCTESQLDFLHCQDYDIKIIYVCPLQGHIICKAHIKIGALKNGSKCKPAMYCSEFIFTWSIETDAFKVLISPSEKLCPVEDFKPMPPLALPKVCRQEVWVQNYLCMQTKTVLRDYSRNYEVYLERGHAHVVASDDYIYLSDFSSSDISSEESLL